ncbi:MAG: hypothetical protein Q9170_004187 [Blastenia crenularia]
MAVVGMVDPAIFEQLQANIDDDTHVREEIRNVLQKLERQDAQIMAVVFCVWLGAGGKPQGSLPTIEEVASTLDGKL